MNMLDDSPIGNSGVVDEYVDATPSFFGFINDCPALVVARDVEWSKPKGVVLTDSSIFEAMHGTLTGGEDESTLSVFDQFFGDHQAEPGAGACQQHDRAFREGLRHVSRTSLVARSTFRTPSVSN